MIRNEGRVLRFFVSEGDRYEGVPLYEWIVLKAQSKGISAACAFRGLEGFGAHRRLRSFRFFRLVQETPVVVKLVDRYEKLSSFLDLMRAVIAEGLVTVSDAEISIFGLGKPGAEDS
jgi:PII-like signaling protein